MSNVILYTGTDIDLTISISGIEIDDIADISLTLRKTKLSDIVFTLSGGDITISGDEITARIPDDAVTVTGIYYIRVTITDLLGNIRGLNPEPRSVNFE